MSHPIVSREDWLVARRAHLDDEKAFTRARDALSARRRALPWLRVEKTYTFATTDGPRTLSALFGSRRQLIICHFMFGPDWTEGCPSCSFWSDGYDRITDHLAHRDTAFVVVSNTGLDRIEAYRTRMGWSLPWVSSLGSDFNRDFAVSFTPEEIAAKSPVYNHGTSGFPTTEAPGLSVFFKPDDTTLVHTYSTYARGLDMLNTAYHLLDLTPKGRDEDDGIMHWLRRRDEYDT
ncbi:MAG: thioredoxin family protein [Pseudomonadota bacterium]